MLSLDRCLIFIYDLPGTSMPVFIVIATKFQKLPFSVLEVCMSGDKMCRIQKADDVVDSILTVQKAVSLPLDFRVVNIFNVKPFPNADHGL